MILGTLLLKAADQPTIWPANGILLGLLLTSHRSFWPAYLAGGVVANVAAIYLVGFPVSYMIRFPLCNLLELSLALLLFRGFVGENYDLSQPRILTWFAVIAVVLAPLVSVLFNAVLFSFVARGVTASFVLELFFAHALGIITITPVVL